MLQIPTAFPLNFPSTHLFSGISLEKSRKQLNQLCEWVEVEMKTLIRCLRVQCKLSIKVQKQEKVKEEKEVQKNGSRRTASLQVDAAITMSRAQQFRERD